jgi:hypothetical protein
VLFSLKWSSSRASGHYFESSVEVVDGKWSNFGNTAICELSHDKGSYESEGIDGEQLGSCH